MVRVFVFTITTFAFIVTVISAAYVPSRCGPFYNYLACPTGASGSHSNATLCCSKWGYCNSDASFCTMQEAGYYLHKEAPCTVTNGVDTCPTGQTCDVNEFVCSLSHVNASNFTAVYGPGVPLILTTSTAAPANTTTVTTTSSPSTSPTSAPGSSDGTSAAFRPEVLSALAIAALVLFAAGI